MDALTFAAPQSPEQNPALLYLAGLTARSGRVSQASTVKVIAEWLGGTPETVNWGALRYEHTVLIVTKIAEAGYAPATRRKYHAALRGILESAWKLGYLNTDEYTRAADLKPVRGEKRPAGRFIPPEEIAKIFQVIAQDQPAVAARDTALFAVFLFAGPRREEITNMDLDDYDPATGDLKITGKGQKERVACIANNGLLAMNRWITVRGSEPGPLFLAINKTGKIRSGRITPQAIYNIVEKRILEAGLENTTPHDFRRTSITLHLDSGTDVSLVARIFGHQNPATTLRYDRRPETAMRRAAANIEIPL